MSRYRANVKRDEGGVWIARVPDLAGVHTNAKRLDQVAGRVAEAIALALDIDVAADDVELVVDYGHLGLSETDAITVRDAAVARVSAAAAQHRAETTSWFAIRTLAAQGFTQRDIGALVGVSHQRVHQLTHKA